MQPIRECLIYVVPIRGRHKWRDDKIEVGEGENDNHGKSSRDRRRPVKLSAIEVDVDEARGDEEIDNREGIGNDAKNRMVRYEHEYHITAEWSGVANLRMKLYASPGGGANMMMTETTQCSKRPAKGALKGLLLAKNPENGRIPSRPSS